MIQVQIIAIRKPVGTSEHHSAISDYRWKDETGQVGDWSRMTMVNWILQNPQEHKAYVRDRKGDVAYCKVMKNQYGTLYLETYADGIHADNLLALPRF